jgi:nucleoid DNA-binding protein
MLFSLENKCSKRSFTKGDAMMRETKTTEMVGKQELVRRIAKQVGISQKQAGEILDATLITIKEALQAGEQIHLAGFGSFTVRQKTTTRKGTKPANRKSMSIPTKDHVGFERSPNPAEPVFTSWASCAPYLSVCQ